MAKKRKVATEVEVEEIDKTQLEEMKDYVKSDEFNDVVKDTMSHRLQILQEHGPEMKDIKAEFVDYMLAAAKDNEDFDEKEDAKKFRKIFKKVVDFTHYIGGYPKMDSPAKLEMLAESIEIAVKYLDFAHDQSFRNRLAAHGIYLDDKKTKTLKDDYPALNEETWENFKAMIDDGSECQGKICTEADKIKEVYEDLPEEYKYSRDNKVGLKCGTFGKFVTAEAMKSIKSEDKMTKKLQNMSTNSMFTIAREEVTTEHLAEMLDQMK